MLKIESVVKSHGEFDTFVIRAQFEDQDIIATLDWHDGTLIDSRVSPNDEELVDAMTEANAWEELEEACK